MSLSPGDKLPYLWLERLDRILQRRWVQACVFLGTFVLVWLLGTKTAHAGWLPRVPGL